MLLNATWQWNRVQKGSSDFGCRLSAGGHVSMWPDCVGFMATGQEVDELDQTEQSINVKATAALGGGGGLPEYHT